MQLKKKKIHDHHDQNFTFFFTLNPGKKKYRPTYRPFF